MLRNDIIPFAIIYPFPGTGEKDKLVRALLG